MPGLNRPRAQHGVSKDDPAGRSRSCALERPSRRAFGAPQDEGLGVALARQRNSAWSAALGRKARAALAKASSRPLSPRGAKVAIAGGNGLVRSKSGGRNRTALLEKRCLRAVGRKRVAWLFLDKIGSRRYRYSHRQNLLPVRRLTGRGQELAD